LAQHSKHRRLPTRFQNVPRAASSKDSETLQVPTGHANARCRDVEDFGKVLELQTVVYDEGGEQEEILVRHLLHIGIGVIPKKIDRNGY
jgi:hypothetical protein